jgi:hypothetical protein
VGKKAKGLQDRRLNPHSEAFRDLRINPEDIFKISLKTRWELKHEFMEIGQERFEDGLYGLRGDLAKKHLVSKAREKEVWKPLE